MAKKVAIALSGGVDSSVAALLLKKQGFDVVAIHAVCFDEKLPHNLSEAETVRGSAVSINERASSYCTSSEDREDSIKIASILDIPIKVVDFTKIYKEKVLDYFIDEYKNNRTPNPDILCNRYIKFKAILEYSLNNLGCDFFATGHYAKLDKAYNLCIPKDKSKDQTYFLALVERKVFEKVIFPLSDLTKTEVRDIASKNNLFNANKPDSQGVCFVGEFKLAEFLKDKFSMQPGVVKNLNQESIGKHFGLQKYTIGQRHGFEINKYYDHPLYVVKKDTANNILYVDKKEFIYSNEFEISNVNLFDDLKSNIDYDVRIRHLGEFYKARVSKLAEGKYNIKLKTKAYAIASGQYCVIYNNEKVIAGGVIN